MLQNKRNLKPIERKGNVIFSGTLKRKGLFFGMFQTCYCELCTSDLYIKKSEAADKYDTEIHIGPDTKITVFKDDKIPRIIISNESKMPREEVCLSADNANDLTTWAVSLRSCAMKPPPGVTMDSFEIVSVIGRGYYGKVMLVKEKESGLHYAMKTIRKNRLFATKKVYTVVNERNILVKANHPFVVRLHYSFQTESKFYFVLEYVPGGELFMHLRDSLKITVGEVRLYLAEIGLALDYLHSIGIVYRDLKTENILLGEDGHIKVTDFGLSKDLSTDEYANSFCGTPEYIAPEIIVREPYGYAVDWWSFGVLAYEMLFGVTPFYNSNRSRMMMAISLGQFSFPSEATMDQRDFISKFLTKDPLKRADLQTMMRHPFWGGLNFDDVLTKKIQPRYIPTINSIESTGNFAEEFTMEPAADSIGSPVLIGNALIQGFSFTNEFANGIEVEGV